VSRLISEEKIEVIVKVLPPFTIDMKTHETKLFVKRGATIRDLIEVLIDRGIIVSRDTLLAGEKLKNNVVVLVNNLVSEDLGREISDRDRVVIMPLVYGGYLVYRTPLVKAAPATTSIAPVTTH